ncbi:ribonuclease HII [Bacteroidota bacterium]
MLKSNYTKILVEAGCDEAGRGCLAGPVVASAVILPCGYKHPLLNDSKKLSAVIRDSIRKDIEKDAIAWSIGAVSNEEIDDINILNASFLAMHRAIFKLRIKPEMLLIDGNRFKPYGKIPHVCIIKGDGKYASIAAASIIAKTHRDKIMEDLAKKHPSYAWEHNKGYPTKQHRALIIEHGISSYHRKSFKLLADQLELF